MLYAGSNLVVGFVTEDGTPVINQVSTGASVLFPQGLVHYQQNLDCYQTTYTISYNSEDPGTQVCRAAAPPESLHNPKPAVAVPVHCPCMHRCVQVLVVHALCCITCTCCTRQVTLLAC